MLVSVYITTRNRIDMLKRAIHSVELQDHKNIELIVCDDHSIDGTPSYLRVLEQQRRLKCILHKKTQGACVARNSAIKLAKGDFITGLDDDDLFTPNRISEFIIFWSNLGELEKRSTAGLYSNSVEKYPNCEKIKKGPLSVGYLELRRVNKIGNQIFAPRENFELIGGFDPEMPAWQDWDCWLRMSRVKGEFRNCQKDTYIHDASYEGTRISVKNENIIRSAHKQFKFKINDINPIEKLALNKALVSYRQVIPSPKETLFALLYGESRLFLSCLKRIALRKIKG